MNMFWRCADEIRHCDMSTSDISVSFSAGKKSRQIISLLYFLCLSLSVTQTQTHTHTCAAVCQRQNEFSIKVMLSLHCQLEKSGIQKKRGLNKPTLKALPCLPQSVLKTEPCLSLNVTITLPIQHGVSYTHELKWEGITTVAVTPGLICEWAAQKGRGLGSLKLCANAALVYSNRT